MRRLFGLWNRRESAAEKPLRDELLSIERLEERALALAASFTVEPSPSRRSVSIFPRFDDNARVLRAAYRTLADDVRAGRFVSSASEWLLDNFHLVTSEIRDIRQNLPRTYYRELPMLASRDHVGRARIYAIAIELVRHSDSRLDRQQLTHFLNSYQRVAPLTIGELWAWPSMLKLALIENLRRLAEETLAARAERLAADAYVAQLDGSGAGASLTLPPLSHTAFVVELLHRVREYGIRQSPIRAAVEEHLVAAQTTAEDAIRRRAPAPGAGPGLRRQCDHEPALLRHPRLATVRRSREPGRAGVEARPCWRLRADGFPQPGPAAAGDRGTGGVQRRRSGAGGAEGRGECPSGRREAVRRPIVPRTSDITSSTGGGAPSRPTWPTDHDWPIECAAWSWITRPPSTLDRSRS